MKISYKKLWVMLIEREIPKAVFRQATELSPGTMSKLNKNEEVALSVLTLEKYAKLCEWTRNKSVFSYSYFCKIIVRDSIYGGCCHGRKQHK